MSLIVFDLDGTLVDSRLDLAESANELLASYGAAPLGVEAIVAMVGDGAAKLVARAFRAAAIDPPLGEALGAFLAIYDRRLLNHTVAYPGIAAALEAVAPMARLAVLTNKPQRHTDRLLDALGLARWFPAGIVGGDTPLGRKPDPAGLRSLMQAAGALPERTLMVGDSRVDAETAARAGARFCLAGYGFGDVQPSTLPSDAVVAASPGDLQPLLEAFARSARAPRPT